ncbi:Glycerate kinase [Pseudonocardia sp. Ae168_Ps1]|uniref:glycerate kinase n=1 Tax=unclassified Pseudonocardia TaxID=2619320 RepID=UPI00094AC9F8|nr:MULTISPECIES: glycerate kinase [unclassified Pseudonocardia]OLL72430.1 Glycerate kinase [Pseudonocardia sp. Ae150A_Ps1]OLL78402.1 Glycerate kinase [Pseudonocardia sp. Ae168_Ps1]OLL87472.1 Glycerate kinase [Pseudonocardia sp. Ae263_Ps1]OLL92499.1 Glycerate kinase [Pseudonocardia sp. Ae356_Ps1]
MSAILLAPDKFKGSLDAAGVAAALADGIAGVAPDREVRRCPVADGGEGTVAAALAAGWTPVTVPSTGPTGAPLPATYARRGAVALVELAATSGLAVLPGGVPDPLGAGTEGLGTVLAHALGAGATELVVGLGGSATTDGGAGVLRGLGARVLDCDGRDLPPGGAALARADRIDLTGLHPRLRGTRIVLAADVDNPLLGPDGAAAVYGPQKGADPAQVTALDAALSRWADVVAGAAGRDPAALAGGTGAGAAGGAGLGLTALCGATLRPGLGTVLDLTGFHDALGGAGLVVTGEGRLDGQPLHGKAPAGVAAAARAAGVPVVAVAGEVALDPAAVRAAGFRAAHALVDLASDRSEAMTDAARLLRRVGATIARLV